MGYYFINEEYIKENSPIANNVEVKTIVPFVKQVSDGWIQSILGSYFYADLLQKYNDTNLSADEQMIVDKIQQALVWKVTSEVGVNLTMQLTDKGYQKQQGANSTSIDLSELSFVTQTYSKNSDFYMERLRRFLELNEDLFPAFTSESNKDSDLKPKTDSSYSSSIMFL